MMKRCSGFPFLLLASTLCCAQDSATYRACSQRAITQSEMNACASNEAKRADNALNKVYKQLLSKVRDNPLATAKIRGAQRAWVAYRDAYIEAMYPAKDKAAEYGSMFPMEVALLTAKLTGQQISALRDILRKNEPK
jgi:uncharacterized protein YecT (DUF1311 family)